MTMKNFGKCGRAGFQAVVCAAAMLAAGAAGQARADTVKAGVLTCNVDGGAGFIFGSSKELHCVFRPDAGEAEHYAGAINKFGVDIGVTGKAVLTWWVYAPTSKLGKGALAGNYSGAAADVSVVVGGGANVLVGGSQNTVSLQPLSLQGQTGLNAAVAVASIDLRRTK
jgi:hypothetical protein